MDKAKTIFRPPWTCGRYHEASHSAIMYNLLAGYAFFFEDESADVIGILLSLGRNGSIDLGVLSDNSGIAQESLKPFVEELSNMGLVCDSAASEEITLEYRAFLNSLEIHNTSEDNPFEQLTVSQNDAEKAYMRRSHALTGAIMLELTYNCSEKCIHCYNPGATRNDNEISRRGRQELNLDDYKRIINDFYDNGLVKVCITGGDPFSKREVWEIIEYLYDKDIAIEVFTNGQNLLGKEDKLAKFFPSDVGMSLYGPTAEIHDKVTRIPGSFKKSVDVLSRLAELHIPSTIKCTLMRNTVKHYPKMFDVANQYHSEIQIESRLFDGLDGDKSVTKHLRLTPEQLRIVVRDKRLPFYVGADVDKYGAVEQDLSCVACRAGIGNFCVTPEGYLIPCCSYHAKLGDLKKSSICDILYDNPAYERFKSLYLSEYTECGKYDYCSFCKMCPGLNFATHGTPLKASENNCYLAKVRYDVVQEILVKKDPLKGKTVEEALSELEDFGDISISREEMQSHFNERLNL